MNVADVLDTTIENGEVRVNLGDAMSGAGEAALAGIWCTAGVVSVPEAPSSEGACQALYVQDGHAVRVVGYRDNRNAAKAGALAPGDFAIVNGGNARFLLKRENESLTLYTETADHSIMLDVNAADNRIFATCGGSFLEIRPDGATLCAGGCSVELKDGVVSIIANYIGLNSAKGNLGVLPLGIPGLPGVNSIVQGPTGVAGVGSLNWVTVP